MIKHQIQIILKDNGVHGATYDVFMISGNDYLCIKMFPFSVLSDIMLFFNCTFCNLEIALHILQF